MYCPPSAWQRRWSSSGGIPLLVVPATPPSSAPTVWSTAACGRIINSETHFCNAFFSFKHCFFLFLLLLEEEVVAAAAAAAAGIVSEVVTFSAPVAVSILIETNNKTSNIGIMRNRTGSGSGIISGRNRMNDGVDVQQYYCRFHNRSNS